MSEGEQGNSIGTRIPSSNALSASVAGLMSFHYTASLTVLETYSSLLLKVNLWYIKINLLKSTSRSAPEAIFPLKS